MSTHEQVKGKDDLVREMDDTGGMESGVPVLLVKCLPPPWTLLRRKTPPLMASPGTGLLHRRTNSKAVLVLH